MSKQAATSVAAAVFLVVVAATSAIALNLGLLGGLTPDEQVSAEAPLSTSEQEEATAAAQGTTPFTTLAPGLSLFPNGVEVVTVYVDEPVPASPGAASATAASATAAPVAAAPRPASPAAGASTPAPASPTQPPATPAPTQPPTTTTTTTTTAASTATAPPQTTAPTTAAPATTTTAATAPQWEYPSFTVPGVGEVILQKGDGEIRYYGAYPINGWKFIVEDAGPDEVKVKFALIIDGEVEDEAQFKAELDHGRIETEIES